MYGLIPMSCRRSVLALPVLCAIAAAADLVDFNRDVRPILSDRCFGCHGPDANKGRKAGLRLDEFAGATKQLKSGDTAIVPGDLKKSEVWTRITSDDEDDVMPPPKDHKPLQPAQVLGAGLARAHAGPFQEGNLAVRLPENLLNQVLAVQGRRVPLHTLSNCLHQRQDVGDLLVGAQ